MPTSIDNKFSGSKTVAKNGLIASAIVFAIGVGAFMYLADFPVREENTVYQEKSFVENYLGCGK